MKNLFFGAPKAFSSPRVLRHVRGSLLHSALRTAAAAWGGSCVVGTSTWHSQRAASRSARPHSNPDRSRRRARSSIIFCRPGAGSPSRACAKSSAARTRPKCAVRTPCCLREAREVAARRRRLHGAPERRCALRRAVPHQRHRGSLAGRAPRRRRRVLGRLAQLQALAPGEARLVSVRQARP